MYHQGEPNPHFHPLRDPVPSQTPPSSSSRRPPHHQSRTSVQPPYGPRTQPPKQHPQPHPAVTPPQTHQESRPHFASDPDSLPQSGRGQHPAQHGHHRHSFQQPTSRRTRPIAWLVAAFCALFWIIIIVGGLIILIVYLLFRPRNPRFDVSTATFNAAYLDMGYLLNADVTVLTNFTNPNTKVNVDFSYVVLDLYYDNNFIATRYIDPFSVMKRDSSFHVVNLVASQVRLSMGQSMQLQKQIGDGRVHFEIKGLFRARSKLGGIFRYSYWLYAHCQIVVTGPPTGVLVGKKCVTKR